MPIAAPWLCADHWALWGGAEELLRSLAFAVQTNADARGRRGEDDVAEIPLYEVHDGVAAVGINGVMVRRAPDWAIAGGYATSTDRARAALATAARDPNVRAIMLSIGSPGGSVSGTQELANMVKAVRAVKPVRAHASDLAASAAYWVGSQAETFSAGETAVVGSIGVITSLYDFSRALADHGVRVEVVRSAPAKGGPQFGEAIGPDEIARTKALIDDLAAVFTREVQSGRGARLGADQNISTGDVWLGPKALAAGLIDSISDEGSAFAAFSRSTQRGPIMSFFGKLFSKATPADLAEAKAAIAAAEKESAAGDEQSKIAELERQLAEAREAREAAELANAKFARETIAREEFSALAGSPAELAADLAAIDQLPADARARVVRRLKAANAQAAESATVLRQERGGLGGDAPSGAVDLAKSMTTTVVAAAKTGSSPVQALLASVDRAAYFESRKPFLTAKQREVYGV